MLIRGRTTVESVIGTKRGDRTFIDVVIAVEEAIALTIGTANASSPAALLQWAKANLPRVVAEATLAISNMTAKKGRARYLGGREVGTRDPGAEIVGDFIVAFVAAL